MKLIKIITNILLAVIVMVAGMFVAGHLGVINFYKPFVVLSGSMEPNIMTGSVVFVQPNDYGYMEGDVITFMTSADGTPTTHRIEDLVYEGDTLVYKTKGDANRDPDKNLVDPRNVIGRVNFTIPNIGYAAQFAGTPQGFVALVIIPATILIYEELKKIWNELVGFAKRKGKKKDETSDLPDLESGQVNRARKDEESNFSVKIESSQTDNAPTAKKKFILDRINKHTHKIAILGLGITIGTFFGLNQSYTQASYSDIEEAVDNYFGAASEYELVGTPIDLPEECSLLQGKIFVVIEGSEDDDDIKGTEASELIYGYGGNDEIDGKGGDDCIIAGDGDDEIKAKSGDDIVYGGRGEDEIDGGSGKDLIYGGEGDDELDGGGDEDEIHGGSGNDEIKGGNQDDILHGDAGDDEIDGKAGNDFIYGGLGKDTIKGGSGIDTLEGNVGDDRIKGGSGDDILDGGLDYDILDGDSGSDTCSNGEDLTSCEV